MKHGNVGAGCAKQLAETPSREEYGKGAAEPNITEVVPLLPVGQTVHFDFEFIGGTEPYHFALVDGVLPPGVNLTGSGGLRGKPRAAGFFDAFIQVTDAAGCTLTVAYNIQVE